MVRVRETTFLKYHLPVFELILVEVFFPHAKGKTAENVKIFLEFCRANGQTSICIP